MAKTLIIDDEPLAREILKTIIEENCPELEIVATADDVLLGVKAIQQHKPDIVFLDIEMPGYSGFQLLDFFDEIDFQIVFTTAHAEHALRAFQVSAVDYILKPLQIEQIVKAVKKALILRGEIKRTGSSENIMVLKENLKDGKVNKIALPMTSGLMFVRPSDIISLSADGAYTNVVLSDGSKLVISKKLKDFEDVLRDNPAYFRSHRSYMINIDFVKQFSRKDGGIILMERDIEIPLAKEKRGEFFNKIDAHLI